MTVREQVIRKYYRCFEDKDKKALEEIITENFTFISAYAEFNSKKHMLEVTWPAVIQNSNELKDLRIFEFGGSRYEYVVKYKLHTQSGVLSMAEYIKFDKNKITEVEVFTGKKEKEF